MSIIGNAIIMGGGGTLPDAAGVSFGGEYAFIRVTYPEGSTCTCTKGNTTLTAEDVSGSYIFVVDIPSSGTDTWTVSCTDGSHNSSYPVEISVAEIINIKLSYIISFYLNRGTHILTLHTELGMTWAEYINSPYNDVNTSTNYPLCVDTQYDYVYYCYGNYQDQRYAVRDGVAGSYTYGSTEIIEGNSYSADGNGSIN